MISHFPIKIEMLTKQFSTFQYQQPSLYTSRTMTKRRNSFNLFLNYQKQTAKNLPNDNGQLKLDLNQIFLFPRIHITQDSNSIQNKMPQTKSSFTCNTLPAKQHNEGLVVNHQAINLLLFFRLTEGSDWEPFRAAISC